MKNLKIIIQFIIQSFFVTIFFSTVEAKNPNYLIKGRSVSNYFSGLLSLNNNQYGESYKYFNRLNNFEKNHSNFAKKYLFTLINLGKINEAFNFAKKLEKKNLSIFEFINYKDLIFLSFVSLISLFFTFLNHLKKNENHMNGIIFSRLILILGFVSLF